MKSLILLCLAAGASAYVCDTRSLCDDVQLCTQGMFCAEKDPIMGLGKCCIDTDNLLTDPPLQTNFPIFPTTQPAVTIPYIPMTQPPFIPKNPMTEPPISIFPPGYPHGQCQDRINPITGIPDCHTRAALCTDSAYYDTMTKECPKTCGRCGQYASTIMPTTYTRTSIYGNCFDKSNPKTGLPECSTKIHLCQNSLYKNIMRKECPVTCGFCSPSGATTRWSNHLSTTTRRGYCQDRLNPKTGRSDCLQNLALCKRSDYATLMRSVCPKTCGFC